MSNKQGTNGTCTREIYHEFLVLREKFVEKYRGSLGNTLITTWNNYFEEGGYLAFLSRLHRIGVTIVSSRDDGWTRKEREIERDELRILKFSSREILQFWQWGELTNCKFAKFAYPFERRRWKCARSSAEPASGTLAGEPSTIESMNPMNRKLVMSLNWRLNIWSVSDHFPIYRFRAEIWFIGQRSLYLLIPNDCWDYEMTKFSASPLNANWASLYWFNNALNQIISG